MFSYHLPFSCTIPGRHQDESKLCLTNTLVLFSLHGKLARTADIIRSKTIFFPNISLFFPPSQADVHCCCSVVYPIRVVSTTSEYLGVFILRKGDRDLCVCVYTCTVCLCIYFSMHPIYTRLYMSMHVRLVLYIYPLASMYACVRVFTGVYTSA